MPPPHELAPPRHWTPRDLSRPTDGYAGEAISLLLGRPWTPAQRLIGEVAGELSDPDTGEYVYNTVVVLKPRQSGKTTTAYDTALGRGRLYRDFRCRYTTHQGTITTGRFTDWFLELERNPAFLRDLKLRRSQGTEGILRRRTGSYFQAFPPKDGALRSNALDMVVVDEAQEHDEILGAAMRRTITPTFATRRRRQLWIVLTAGTDASTYALGYLRKALAGAPGHAIFDYGCPDGVDPLDRDLWHTWHPGLAYGLTDYAALDMALQEDAAAFTREYGNVWTRTSGGIVYAPADWAAVQLPPDTPRPAGRLCLGVHLEADRSAAAIAVAAEDGYREIVDFRNGADWVTGRCLELQASTGAPIAVDRYGATGTVADALELAGAELLTMATQDVANATAAFLDGITAQVLRIFPTPALTESLEGAATRALPRDTGGFAWSHANSAGPIAPLVATCAAGWGFDRTVEKRKPVARA
jgi:hypothetical protein